MGDPSARAFEVFLIVSQSDTTDSTEQSALPTPLGLSRETTDAYFPGNNAKDKQFGIGVASG